DFEASSIPDHGDLALFVNYDDAFIAYLNGREVARANIQGAGADAKEIGKHEAVKFEKFEIKDWKKHLKPGRNVLALEGHNDWISSTDFSLDPYLVMNVKTAPSTSPPKKGPPEQVAETPKKSGVRSDNFLRNFVKQTQYSSGSRQLVVIDRRSGKVLWTREARFNFRHNTIVSSPDLVFCIDSMTAVKIQSLKRRGIEIDAKPTVYALDIKTGEVVWSNDKNVFGTFLSYNAEHDVLVQAGAKARDRARDEIDKGMVAYQGKDGTVLWKDLNRSHGGPLLLYKDKIITNGQNGQGYELLTGKPWMMPDPISGKPVPWTWTRKYGCNTAVGCQNLMTFRSGAAGFYDLISRSGTANLGGFRSSCTANLIPANGVFNAPDYTRTCNCGYQNQTS
ncbi:MAG: PQQ-binding-like beta-propeller repeat protein, partial [Verrucomicrobiota bacterium]